MCPELSEKRWGRRARSERAGCQVETLSELRTATQRPQVYSKAGRNGTSQRNALSLYRKRHITASGFENSTLHEVTKFWGQHSHSLGVKLTPQLDREKARVCTLLPTCKYVRISVCTHSCVSSVTLIPIFLLLRKLTDPSVC